MAYVRCLAAGLVLTVIAAMALLSHQPARAMAVETVSLAPGSVGRASLKVGVSVITEDQPLTP